MHQIRNSSVSIWEEQTLLESGCGIVLTSCLLFMYWGHRTGQAILTVGITATLCCFAFLWSCCMQAAVSRSLSPRYGAPSGCGWKNGLRYGRQLRIYWMDSRQWGSPQVWGLGEVLTTPYCKNWPSYETLHRAPQKCESSEFNLIYVAYLAPGILNCLIDFF